MVDYKVIKVSKQNYNALLREASRIQYETGEKATFDDAVGRLVDDANGESNKKLMELFGVWKDKDGGEISAILKSISAARVSDKNIEDAKWK